MCLTILSAFKFKTTSTALPYPDQIVHVGQRTETVEPLLFI